MSKTKEDMSVDEIAKQFGVDTSSFDAGFETPQQRFVKWGRPGDVVRGTLTGKTESLNKLSGGKQTIYEFIADAGQFHFLKKDEATGEIKVDTSPTILEVGGRYLVAIQEKSRKVFSEMEQVKIGQRFLIRFTGVFKTDKGSAKTLEVKIGGMNEEALKPVADELDVDAIEI